MARVICASPLASSGRDGAVASADLTLEVSSIGPNGLARNCQEVLMTKLSGLEPDINSTLVSERERVSHSASSMPVIPPGINMSDTSNSIRPSSRAATSSACFPLTARRTSNPPILTKILWQNSIITRSSSTNRMVGITPPTSARLGPMQPASSVAGRSCQTDRLFHTRRADTQTPHLIEQRGTGKVQANCGSSHHTVHLP
jgi:hypothetical protein